MNLDTFTIFAISSAISAILMLGTNHLRINLFFYRVHTLAIALETAWLAQRLHDVNLYWIAFFIILLKVISIPQYLQWVMTKIDVQSDSGPYIAAPLAMTMGVGMLG